MSTLKDTLLQKIHTASIRPRPRWQYIVFSVILWIAGLITLCLGAVAFSLVLFDLSTPERVYHEWMNMRDFDIFWSLPILWGIGVVIALTLTYFLFSRTERGYRFHALRISGLLLVGTIIGGDILYVTHTIHLGDHEMRRMSPRYGDFRQRFSRSLPGPAEGVLPLMITTQEGDIFYGKSIDQTLWEVTLKCEKNGCQDRSKNLPLNAPILFFGTMGEGSKFHATDVRFPPRERSERERF